MITIQKWSGLVTNASPYALPGGACVSQVNMQCLRPGQVQCRAGLSAVISPNGQVLSAVRMAAGSTQTVAMQVGGYITLSTV
jgi:ribosomal protein L2